MLVDFWTNHFNIDVRKDACRVYYVAYDREAIRPHVFCDALATPVRASRHGDASGVRGAAWLWQAA